MNQIDTETLAIEELRRRAKDNKAQSVIFFTKLSEGYLDKTRSILFLVSFSLLGYLGTIQKSLSFGEAIFIIFSIFSGLVSYIFSYKYSLSLANYYAELEENLRVAFPTQKQYENMLLNENNIRKKHKNRHIPQAFAVIGMITQALVLIIILICTVAN